MDDEKLLAMCHHIRQLVDYIEHGTEVDGSADQ